jgi:DNA polymerase-3 subunit beta
MKVICDRGALLDAVTLTLSATDLEVGLRLTVEEVDVQDEGDLLVPADKLTQIVRASDDATLTIETEGHTAHIRGADSHFKVFGFDPGEAPQVRGFDDVEVDCEMDSGALRTLISRTIFAAAAEHSRYAINGVLFERTGRKLRLVATDGRRLAVAIGDCATPKDGDARCIVPTKALQLAGKLLTDAEATVRIAVEENQAMFAVGDEQHAAVLSTKLVEGAFPPFEDVIPKDQDKKVVFDAGALSSAIRRAALLTNEESKGVRLSFANDQLTLTSRAPEMGEAEIQLKLDSYDGEPLEIGFNPGYIIDALKVVDEPQVLIELKAPNKPGVLRSGKEFTYVIMPVNLQ